jgi:NAD(P)-dependent dehydrogenase (short-subunit alcohol dehydrogenase family)
METQGLELKGQVAIVTGGGSGIGQSIAIEFVKAGADVVLVGRRLTVLEETAKEIKTLGGRSLCISADISQKSSVDNMVRTIMAEFGMADILVNNAGITDDGAPLLQLGEDVWDRVINTNLKGYFLCCQAVGKTMVEYKKGKIINIASIAGFTPMATGGIYNISKAGVVMLTKLLARQLASYNIRVNAIAPGYVNTPMAEPIQRDPERLSKVEAFIPLGHMAEPIDIANAALFLASTASKHMTGHTMLIDGGQLLQYKYRVE